jgi:hypothetical protein
MSIQFPKLPSSLHVSHAPYTDTCVAFKAFDASMRCYGGFQYAVGETYVHTETEAKTCSHGFHACLEPLDILSYYDARFAVVTISGLCPSPQETSKTASCVLTIEREITRGELTELQVAYCVERGAGDTSSGDNSKASSSGYSSMASSSGHYSMASSAGGNSKASSSGYSSMASSSGDNSKASSSGDNSKASSSGYSSMASSSGHYSMASSSGDDSMASSSGDDSMASSAGGNSKASSSGYSSMASSSGDNSKASSSGDCSTASCDTNGFACVAGVLGKAKGAKGSALSLGYLDSEGRPRIAVAYIGENGIEPNTWYRVDDNTGHIIPA